VLDVWYFMLSTSMISIKLILAFYFSVRSNPGYIEPATGPKFEMKALM